jgi:putative FmdB family regulatory protein
MPIFEFICKKCNKKFETLVFSNDEKVECPACKSEEIIKQLSSFASGSNSSPSCATADYCPSPHKHKCSKGCCHH